MASPLYVTCAVLNWTRYLDIAKLVSNWRWCLSGPCWTACIHSVTLSAFSGRWKARAALRKLKRDNNQQKAFGELGNSRDLQPGLFHELQRFTCDMYAPSSNTCQVNKLCYELFSAKRVKLILVNFLPVKTEF